MSFQNNTVGDATRIPFDTLFARATTPVTMVMIALAILVLVPGIVMANMWLLVGGGAMVTLSIAMARNDIELHKSEQNGAFDGLGH